MKLLLKSVVVWDVTPGRNLPKYQEKLPPLFSRSKSKTTSQQANSKERKRSKSMSLITTK
jgi:hypothetical protein